MNNIGLWEGMLKMRINNRSTFDLETIVSFYKKSLKIKIFPFQLKDINRAIEKLVNVKMGVIKSHKPMEGTDEVLFKFINIEIQFFQFLVDLLVTRFRLLLSTGFIDRVREKSNLI